MLNSAIEVLPASLAHKRITDTKKLTSGFVTITAVKKDGTEFTINGQLVASPKSHKNSPHLLTIRHPKRGSKPAGFKVVNTCRVTRVTGNGMTLKAAK